MLSGIIIIGFAALLAYLLCRLVMKQGIRDSLVVGWLLLSLFVFCSTEVLSLFGEFTPTGILMFWRLLCGVLMIALFFHRDQLLRTLENDFRRLVEVFKSAKRAYPVALFATGGIFLFTLIYVLLAPTSEPDSMSYHLPRVSHWFANRSIRFYETAIARQNFQAPLYSFWLGHLMALTQGDRFFNLIQWYSLIANSVVVSLIAAEIRLSRRYQFLSALFALVVPQALSQVIVAVNDLFAAMMVLAFILYLIRVLNSKRFWLSGSLCAVAFGASLIAKYTSLIHVAGFAVPISIWGLLRIWKRESLLKALRRGAVLVMIVAVGSLLFLPQAVRNINAYGDLFSGEPKNMLTNVNITPQKVAVNWVKNVAMHFATPLYAVNSQTERVVRWLAGDLIESPDISYSNKWYFTDFRIFTPLGKSHLTASNPLHLFLYLIAVTGVFYGRCRKRCSMLCYSVLPVLFGSFVYALVFKWQPACARLHIPYFMLMSLGVALWLSVGKSKVVVEKAVLCLLLGYGMLHVLMWQTWYTPAFLFGELPEEVYNDSKPTSLQKKIRVLAQNKWDKSIISHMKATVPPEMQHGYSLFFTERMRQYLGNSYHDNRNVQDMRDLKATIERIKVEHQRGLCSDNIALLISSVHGNTPCDPDNLEKEIFDREFLLWLMLDNIDASKPLRFRHLGVKDPHISVIECFGKQPGLILSDRTRESVLRKLSDQYQFETLLTNDLFTLYYAVPQDNKNAE